MSQENQIILSGQNGYTDIDHYIERHHLKKILLVCGKSIRLLALSDYFMNLKVRKQVEVIIFDQFMPNPNYESVATGIRLFQKEQCDSIIAVGGGSAIDVAKCIKIFSALNPDEFFLKQKVSSNSIPFLVIPTTAGTGSEATKYAVIYYQGEKQSISDEGCIPNAVLFEPNVLKSLPEYHRKAAMLDAFCHALESFWSIHSTEESKKYARNALKLILSNKDAYLLNKDEGNRNMLMAANLAGKAINITQTTAGHAMCYKLTSFYQIAHGHAAAMCVVKLFPYMVRHVEWCLDPRGKKYLQKVFIDIANILGCKSTREAEIFLENFLGSMNLLRPVIQERDIAFLSASVNPVRLKNNPIALDERNIENLYREILLK